MRTLPPEAEVEQPWDDEVEPTAEEWRSMSEAWRRQADLDERMRRAREEAKARRGLDDLPRRMRGGVAAPPPTTASP